MFIKKQISIFSTGNIIGKSMKLFLISFVATLFSSALYAQQHGVLMVNTIDHYFSNRVKKDKFKLKLIGTTILTGKVVFEIETTDHRKIHTETFPGLDLCGDMDDGYVKAKQKRDTIISRFRHFFDNVHFVTPALTKNMRYDKDNYDKAAFYELKADPTATGFIYSHGYEGTYGIAWSKKKNEVVNYFYSD